MNKSLNTRRITPRYDHMKFQNSMDRKKDTGGGGESGRERTGEKEEGRGHFKKMMNPNVEQCL